MIVVTGASGHVGGNLVRSLLDLGRPVRAMLHKDRRALDGLNVEIVRCDIRDPESLTRAIKGAEVVFHAAGYISLLMDDWPLLKEINILGTRNVVEACLTCGVRRLIHFSSIHALCQEPLNSPVDETRPYAESRSAPPYDRSKAAGEKEVLKGIQKGLNAVIINPTGIIGPFDFRPSHSGQVILSLAGGSLPALVRGGFDWVDVRDIIQGALRAEEKAPMGARYILSGHWASAKDIAIEVERFTGIRSPWFVTPIWLARMGAPFITAVSCWMKKRPLYTVVSLKALKSNRVISHARATKDLDYHPRPFQDTIRDTVNWFAENGWIDRLPDREQ